MPNIIIGKDGVFQNGFFSTDFTEGGLRYEWHNLGPGVTADEATMDSHFIGSPDGSGIRTTIINWSNVGYTQSQPAYLPAIRWAWKAEGQIFLPENGTYNFAVDCDDAADMFVDKVNVSNRYGAGAPELNYSSPNIIKTPLTRNSGWYDFKVRLRQGSSGSTLSVAWNKPSDSSYGVIPVNRFRYN
jgi:hypothetical protein